MKKYKAKAAIGMLVALLMVMGTVAVLPTGTYNTTHSSPNEKSTIDLTPEDQSNEPPYILDQSIREEPIEDPAAANLQEDQGDVNYNTDTGNSILKSLPLYPGEVRDRAPGRGTQGYLDPSGDADDWYYFTALQGQTINIRVTPESNFDIELVDGTATTIASSANTGTTAETIQYTVPEHPDPTKTNTGRYFLHIYTADDAAAGHYTIDVTLQGQNDAGSGRDAGNTMDSAMSISPGAYEGYLDVNDWEDWYSFSASSGQGIKIELSVIGEKSDFDVHLYNPSGELVHRAMYYGDDTLEYPADATGTWKFKIDIWPGWDESKWPDNYFLYGSGPYSFELQVGVSVQNPPSPIPQPDVTPIAQTFIVEDDPDSSTDEFGYLAAVPAANYIEGGKRYVSP
ncbi:MAG: PPC domain-containing protein, partial [Candidatus Thermoplasmatota archaeon]|nr:PPC domain-containing protein [Candidatus Thermoplasmatota archaeon]